MARIDFHELICALADRFKVFSLIADMKPNELKSRVAPRHRRESGDAPAIGRVSRLRNLENPAESGRSRRRGEGGVAQHKTMTFIGSAGIGLIAIGALVATIIFWVLPRMNQSAEDEIWQPMENVSQDQELTKSPSPSEKEAIEIARQAILNRDPQRVSSLFRMGKATETEILDFLKQLEVKNGPVERYRWMSNLDKDGIPMEGVVAAFKSHDKAVERLAILTPDLQGKWKVDFDAFARTATPGWDELLEKGADRAIVRVLVGQDSYYNGPFSDDSQWTCYTIVSPDTDAVLQGYCRVGSEQAQMMERIFAEGAKSSRATLELQRVPDADSRQFEITRVHSRDWMVPDAGVKPSLE